MRRATIYSLNLRVGAGIPPIVKVSQNDEGRSIGFRLFDGALAFFPGATAEVTITGTKPSGLGFTETCSVSGSVAFVDTTLAMTQESGQINAELRISDGELDIGTSNFILYVEQAPHPAGTTDGTTEEARTVLERCEQYAQEAQAAAEELPSQVQDLVDAAVADKMEEIEGAVQDVTDASTQAVNDINEAGENVIESIPSDYTALSAQVGTNTSAISQLQADLDDQVADINESLGDSVDSDNGLFNVDSFLFSEDSETIEFVRGMRGSAAGDSCAVVANRYFSCTNLIPVSVGDILTIINLMPTKYRFNVRGYTENEENNGTLISGGANVLNPDLSESGQYSTDYSNTISAVYKNTVEIIKPFATAKYISIHARTFGAIDSTNADRVELNRCIKVIRKNPMLSDVFLPDIPTGKLPTIPAEKLPLEIPLSNLPSIPSGKRTRLGTYGEIIGYSRININTTEKTMSLGSFMVKIGAYRINNPTIDFSALSTAYQTIYYDFDDSTIKIVGYSAYANLANVQNTAYLGSVWQSNTAYPKGYFQINSSLEILVDGVKQLPYGSYFRNKTIACYGDSICLGRTTSSGTTTHLLQDILSKQYGIKATNYAVGGACWAHRTGMSHDLSALVPSSTIDTDFILLFAGTNDYGTNRQLGTIDDAPSGDEGNTFYAAMHYVLQHIFTQKPNVEVAIVTPTFRSYVSSGGSGDTYNTVRNSAGCTLGDYSDAMIEVAKMYNVPILDMRKMGPINKFNYASMLEEQSEGNHLYLHPKDETYEILYHKICNWLMTVL